MIQIDQPQIREFADKRSKRAEAILQKGEPQLLDEFTYLVSSQFDSNKKYKVTHIDSYSCECQDFERRCKGKGLYCKHIKAILLFEKLKVSYEVEQNPIRKELDLMIEKPLNDCCPYCASKNIIKFGVRKTQLGNKQRYNCQECKKKFVLSPIPKIKGNAKLVCLAMDCFYRGLSYRDISAQFKEFYGLSISHITIRNWVLKFSKLMETYEKTIQPQSQGNVWNADETMVRTKKGNRKKGADYEYKWNVMDKQTKFLLASKLSGHSRKSKDAQKVMMEAYKQNGKIPFQIIVDGYAGYQDGVRKTFRNWGNERKVKFTSIKGHRKEINNNEIENLNGHQKEFDKVRRGINETQTYADGFKTFHNFVRKGVKDKLTPAERWGIGVRGNAWETILLNSIKHQPQLTGEQNVSKTTD
ncbi:DDE-type integrase/transposase/recombinase [Candidatus Pacearchaeota archaeon]|nr:DDE-type integrase/transposase/recombinase [Candidatus Pacearchaeota archaeon]